MGRDLVLTIGMPLAAGLSLEQFVGVLAHEFGHFSQGVGMRLTYVVRSINLWFLRVVYQRDSWDVWLANSTEGLDFRIAWVMYVAQFCVWLTRRVLWVLMMLGNLVAGFMLRQMEFDADSYETRLVGSDTFEATARKLQLLNSGVSGRSVRCPAFSREGRLPDNLPALMTANLRRLPAAARRRLKRRPRRQRPACSTAHPADKDRIAAARRIAAAGVFRCPLPISVIFSDFAATARSVTYDFYVEVVGRHLKPDDLHPVDRSSVAARQKRGGGRYDSTGVRLRVGGRCVTLAEFPGHGASAAAPWRRPTDRLPPEGSPHGPPA